ncbi:DUF4394 domain-containing protein [Hymenobacter sp. BT664]|uniref:DUF4394 domain-containing protein n=1 Tax=Hymenobacter montanus TaxID=2771359 RepID=A0A927BFP7_9BACT|nr:DUF4394 domain-containing protein [Hymenobacter montanus]MBD2770030.1 DUF4394 domain-containing protein [Hymenobacter montanus]
MSTYLPLRLPSGRRLRHLLRTALGAALVLGSSQAQAQTIYGLGTLSRTVPVGNPYFPAGATAGSQGLVPFDAPSGFPMNAPIPISGTTAPQVLVGMDYRPNTGQLYALGYDAAASSAQLYTLNPITGVATAVAAPFTLALGDASTRIGFDFNPTVDRIRVVSGNGTNVRLNPVTGTLDATDTALAYAPGDANASRTPTVGAAAYTNSFITSTSTTLYDVDQDKVLNNGSILAIQNPPNNGTLNTVAPVSLNGFSSVKAILSLDIAYASGTNVAYLSEVTEPNANGLSSSNLYVLNLTTGLASSKKNLVPANALSPFDIRDIAVVIAPPVCNGPSSPLVASVTSNSATVNFTGSPSATTYTVTTTPATPPQTLLASATSVAFSNLTPNTNYTVSIVSNCFGGLLTSTPATVNFNTQAAPTPTLDVTQGGTSYPDNGTAYSFGSQIVGTTSVPVAFTLTNGGPDALTIGSISTTGDYAVSGPAPTTVAAGGTATVSVTFTPTAIGARPGTLVIRSNATNAATYTVNLDGAGAAALANPLIAVSVGGTPVSNGSTFAGFPNTAQGSTSAPVTFTITNGSTTDNLTLGTFATTGPFALSTAQPTSIAPGSSATFNVTFTPTAVGTDTGTLTIPNNSIANNPFVIKLSGQGTSTGVLPDLIVSTTQSVAGSYNNVTITSTGVAILSGTLSVAGTLTVQPGGALVQNCQPLNGPGNFVLQAGASLAICDPAGIASSGAVGAIQVTGSRSFSPAASYAYNGTVAQVTGSGLPSQVLNLGVRNAAGLTLSQAVRVAQVVALQLGNLTTAGNDLTLLSSAAGTALVDNTGGAVLGTATVQRYIDAGSNPGLGYRHYSSPVANSSVADLAAPGFLPIVNPAYNNVGNTATPFPNVYGYNESRVTTSGNSASQNFDQGFYSPNATSDALEVTRGYTVNISGQATVDFVGTLNNGTLPVTSLTRGSQTESGWHLRGNPYPSPLDWASLVNNGRATNLENALYVFKSSGQYSGTYTTYVNGQSTNSGTNVLPLGQGFLVRTVAGQTGSITFSNADRVTTPNATPFQRGTTDTRPQLTLALSNATARTQAVVYFEQGATPGFDQAFDARALPAPNGLTLASETAAAEPLAINGQAALTGADVLVPLRVASRTAGTYTLAVDALRNLPDNYHAYLRDALTGAYTDLATTPTLSLTLAAGAAPSGRYAVLFTTQARLLATAPAALAQLAAVYPNPAHGTATLLLPLALRGNRATAVSVVDNVGRIVLSRTLAAGAGETLELPVANLNPGVYSVLARTTAGLVAKRLVVQ